MAKNRLARLSVRGYKSFRDLSSVEFPPEGMMLLQCLNRDTGGSSGGGKSNFFEAAAAALGFAEAPATETQSWHTEEPQLVALRLDSDAVGEWETVWGPKPSLRAGGERVSGAAAIAERRRKLLGLPEETIGALTYRPQDAGGKILTLPNARLQKFLAGLLPLGVFESAVEAGAKAAADLERKLAAAEALESRAEAALRALKSAPPPPEVDTAALERAELEARARTDAARAAYALADKALKDFDSESPGEYSVAGLEAGLGVAAAIQAAAEFAERPLAAVPENPEIARLEQGVAMARDLFAAAVEAEKAAHAVAAAEARRLDAAIEAALRISSVGAQAGSRADQARNKIAKLRAQTCYGCRRPWVSAEAEAELAQAEAELAQAEAEIEAGTGASAEAQHLKFERAAIRWDQNPEVSEWREEMARLQTQINDLRSADAGERVKVRMARDAEVARLRAAVAEAESRRDRAMAAAAQRRAEERRPREAEASARHEEYAAALREHGQKKSALEAAARSNVARAERARALEAAEREHSEAADAAAKVRAALASERDFGACFGRDGFMGAIFDEILAEIADETNATMATVPNISTVSLTFRSESKTEGGSVVRGIKPVLSVGRHQAPMRSGTSGGMRSAIHLAADAAVRRVIARRTGSMPMWWFLDESFNGLEHACKEACMEILASVARDSLVLVVDHDERFKSMFPKTLRLERSGGATRIVGVEGT